MMIVAAVAGAVPGLALRCPRAVPVGRHAGNDGVEVRPIMEFDRV